MVDLSVRSRQRLELSVGLPSEPQMSSSVSSVTSSRACCENGRPIMTDPHTGQTICSCQYGTALLNYSRVQGLPEGMYGASAAAYAAGAAAQGYVPLGAEGSAFYSPLTSPPFDLKEGSEAWRALAAQSGGCFPYDPSMALYPYGTGYGGLDLNARRKNATRETTNTLKAWLYEHRKNPYPTKGEKIMLAIITKMTLTQVSTWFANARRRLKKENKMTWSPRNRSEDDGSGDEDMDGKGTVNGNDSDGSALNMSLDESKDDSKSFSDREAMERIISVDDDDSCHSDLDDSEDGDLNKVHLKPADKPSGESRLHEDRVDSPGRVIERVAGDKSPIEDSDKHKASRLSSDTARATSSESTSQTSRPKIWSVLDVLGNKNPSSSNAGQSTNSPPAVVCSRQTNGPAFLNVHQNSQTFRNGPFPVGFPGYPLSLSHTTLSYPYTLSASAVAKADMTLKHAAALRASEQAFKEGLAEKAARMQSRIFSPARELDGMRVGGKMVL